MSTLEGIDASSWQGSINWEEVHHNGGKAFAFAKATEGLNYRDPTFFGNWSGMYFQGMVRGAYCFFHPGLDGAEQADYLHEYVRSSNYGHFVWGDFVVLDLEETGGLAAWEVVRRAEAFVQRAKQQIAKPVIIYTNPYTWVDLLGNPLSPVLSRCPLWLADYGAYVPHIRNWPNGLAFWQYSDSGHCPGVSGAVDLNRFYGSWAQLKRLSHSI